MESERKSKQENELPPAGFFRSITPDDQQDETATDLISETVESIVDGLTPGKQD